MYYQHYKLSGPPFQFAPTPGALYLSKTHREGLATLEWGLLHEPTGLTLLVGESGIGKTTLACSILARSEANLRSAYLASPTLPFEQMMQAILPQLFRAAGGRSKFELIESFKKLLDDLTPGERVAIIVDEAQDLADETFEEFRLLSNLDTAPERRLQMIFLGQPELVTRLASPKHNSLNQRIGARVLLQPMNPREVREYIDFRLRARGGETRKIFSTGAMDILVRHSRGIPRRTNVLCHNAMLLGFAAGTSKVTAGMARTAANEFEDLLSARAPAGPGKIHSFRLRTVARGALAVSAVLLVVLALLYAFSPEMFYRLAPGRDSVAGKALRPAIALMVSKPGHFLRPAPPVPILSAGHQQAAAGGER